LKAKMEKTEKNNFTISYNKSLTAMWGFFLPFYSAISCYALQSLWFFKIQRIFIAIRLGMFFIKCGSALSSWFLIGFNVG
jgi:hypothetical protein